MNSRIASMIAFLILVAVMAVMLRLGILLAWGVPGLALQAAAFLLMLWARWTFGRRSFHASADPTEGGLVTTGPYRWVRHPIYAAILLFVWTAALSHLSWTSVLLGFVATAAVAVRIDSEERLVTLRYPEYAAYAKTTKRVLPFVV